MKNLLNSAEYLANPLSALTDFLESEKRNEIAGNYDQLRFVGYVLDIGYDTARIVTCDPYKKAVGGIPRGSFLIMVPDNLDGIAPHFSLLRVSETAPTPLTKSVQETYFELHKKSMPELDRWTASELQWGSLDCSIVGMVYPSQNDISKISFSGDVNTVVSAHRYRVLSPNEKLLNLIVNGMVKPEMNQNLGLLRMTECQLPFANSKHPDIPVQISLKDFLGARTAMFGKTRLGKSNVVKLLAQATIRGIDKSYKCGQLIFDINGEYANDNPQDGNKSLRSANESSCSVFALSPRGKYAKPLRLDFYTTPDTCIRILGQMMEKSGNLSGYVKSFASLQLPSFSEISEMSPGDSVRGLRKIQMYWAILNKAGFKTHEDNIKKMISSQFGPRGFNPKFSKDSRSAVYGDSVPEEPSNLYSMQKEFEEFAKYTLDSSNTELTSSSKEPLFDADDRALLNFLQPSPGQRGVRWIDPFREYHDPNAGDVVKLVLAELDEGKTVILDLGSAEDEVRQYFSDLLSKAIFKHQENKFVENNLGSGYMMLYFEEAHNLFPHQTKDNSDVYSRFAKEGAKFHIGMIYSTQSPSTISQELLAQTENFFVGHLSSQDEAKALARVNIAYDGVESDIMKSRTPGYMRMLTQSHRFVIPMQAFKFEVLEEPYDKTGGQ